MQILSIEQPTNSRNPIYHGIAVSTRGVCYEWFREARSRRLLGAFRLYPPDASGCILCHDIKPPAALERAVLAALA